ncbi:carboxypeptidase-like regulatory domain-containing protein [Chitinophaga filiformis]|uniref:carboxypeptidase-like regulatory domain-containing protein n=1 Tax=Chitinophaga filiformis TaxID=104663 RepID=UPI001F1D253F|nr:carboxypeptidase-like regulatory domain-containing protein [Chitinophaga filiformis]MCF6407769.1 carboxypeptidase-like regulatory domain-containing protein [Chitinophaga filiformis]
MTSRKLRDQDNLKKINETFDELEGRRAEELDQAAQLQDANSQILAEERDRLAKKYGPDHPRVQKLEARLAYNGIMMEGLKAEATRAKVKTEPFASTWWRVNGRVFDSSGKPLAKLTVSLSDASGNGLEPLGYSCTDERGYYIITVKDDLVEKFQRQLPYLTVTDPNKKRLHVEKEPVVVTAGKIDYRDIFIGADKSAICTPPFEETVIR